MSVKKAFFIVFLILLIDQCVKLYIKTHFYLGESIRVFGLEWFQIYFVENEGAAWGARLPGEYGKLILSVFRLIIAPFIGYWLYKSVKENAPKLLTISIALILAGAVGNIIDSLFYGVLFDESSSITRNIASFLPDNGGYAKPLYGNVVDMLYFPFIKNATFPEWFPFIGGGTFTFFNAIFNIADMAISTGVGILLVFNKKVFPKIEEQTA